MAAFAQPVRLASAGGGGVLGWAAASAGFAAAGSGAIAAAGSGGFVAAGSGGLAGVASFPLSSVQAVRASSNSPVVRIRVCMARALYPQPGPTLHFLQR